MFFQEDVETQQQEVGGQYEEVYKDSSTFLKVQLNTIAYIKHLLYLISSLNCKSGAQRIKY